MKKLLIVLSTVIIVIFFAHPAFSIGSGKGNGAEAHDDFDPIALSQLNLTVEQKTKISILREDFLKEIRPFEDQMFSKRGNLKRLWLQQNPDKEKIAIAREEIRDLRNKIKTKRDVYRLKVYNLLDPEQKEKLQACGPNGGFGHNMRTTVRWHDAPGQVTK